MPGIAFAIDMLILAGCTIGFILLIGRKSRIPNEDMILYGFLVYFTYFILQTAYSPNGRTIGMKISGLSVTTIEGKKPQLRQRLGRLLIFLFFVFASKHIIRFVLSISFLGVTSLSPYNQLMIFMSVFISLIVIIPVTRILSKEGVGILDYLSKTLIIFEPIGKNLQIKSASLAIKNSFRVRIVLLRNVFIVCCIIYFIMIGVGHKQKPGVSFLPIDQQFVPLYFLDKLIIDSRCQHYMDLYDKNLSIKWCQEVLVNLEPTIILRGSKMIELETPVSHEVYSSSKLRRLFIKNMISIIDYWQSKS